MAAKTLKGTGSVRLLDWDAIEVYCTENKEVQ